MRTALIYLGRRGAGAWISIELARQLQTRGTILTVTSQYSNLQDRWATLPTENITVPTYRSSIQAIFSLLFPLQIHALVRRLRRFKSDVLLFPMFHPWNAFIQSKMYDIPGVVFVHDPRPHPDPVSWFYGKLEQASLAQSTRCIIMSSELTNQLVQRGISVSQIDVVPLGS